MASEQKGKKSKNYDSFETVTVVGGKLTNKDRLDMLKQDQESLKYRNAMRDDPRIGSTDVVYPDPSMSYTITRDELDKPVKEQYAKGGKVRGDGICQRGRTKGRMV